MPMVTLLLHSIQAMHGSSDLPQERIESPRIRWRLLCVSMSTLCWIFAVLCLLGWLAQIGESFYINYQFGVLQPGDEYYQEHGLTWRLPLGGLAATTAIVLLSLAGRCWWRNRWRRGLVFTVLAFAAGAAGNFVMQTGG